MDAHARRSEPVTDEEPEGSSVVASHEPRPGKLVLTERDNVDGWIATDHAVDLER
ncbi:hypothetical protein OB905_02185 [Halobacteria archaeon AArc-dxtr1]|nr:hypothetical protein [Halobacteria archaeon AArc-dxtr1]